MFVTRWSKLNMNILLSITERCNLRCRYCYYKVSQEDRSADMSNEVMEAALRLTLNRTIELKQNSITVTFFGGEPLLRFDVICRGVEYLKGLVNERREELPEDFFLRFGVNTNGTLLNEEILDYFRKENFYIYLSLDGPVSRHNISRRTVDGRGSFSAIEPFIPALTKLDSFVLSVTTRDNIEGLADSVKWLKDRGFSCVQNMTDFDGKWTMEDFDRLACEYQKLAEFWYNLKKQGDSFYIQTIQDKITSHVCQRRQKTYSCDILLGGLGFATNGGIFPCSRFISSKKNAPYLLGNVLDKNLSVFDGPIAKEVMEFLENDKEQCAGCGIQYRCCAHECGCVSFYTTGGLKGVSPEVCNHERILCAICDEYALRLQNEGEIEDVL